MDAKERARLRALCEAATEGPWEKYDEYGVVGVEGKQGVAFMDNEDESPAEYERIHADAEFIAAARTALPALLSALDRVDALAEEWWVEGNEGGRYAEYEDACRDHARALRRALSGDDRG